MQIEGIKAVAFSDQGGSNAPDLVDIWLWDGPDCKHLLFGQAVAFNVDYTLFSPTGTPLRTKVDLRFKIEHVAGPFDADLAAKPSLDLTHLPGPMSRPDDTLP